MSFSTMAQMRMANNNAAQSNSNNRSANNQSSSDNDEDPCIDPDDQRYCWTQDPITGIHHLQEPDTTHINLGNRQTMASKSLGLVYTGNLFSPHYITNSFDKRDKHDFLFVNAYDLFAFRPEDVVFYNTRIPFTNASYFTSGSSRQSNDHLKLNFAGNFNSKMGIGTFLDYVYARGEYVSQATKPLRWTSYLYYNDDQYKATLTYNVSKLANQENGGIQNLGYIQRPDTFIDNSFVEPQNMPVNLNDAWNDMNSFDIHLTHSYDFGFWDEMTNPDDSTDVWDEFTSVASIFHSVDFESYDHMFRMDKNADQTDKRDFFKNHFINKDITQDSSAYYSFSTYAGIRLNEGFNKYSQFGLSAFVGFEHQGYTMMQDTLNFDYISRNHHSNTLYIGGQLSRHQSSFLNFDVTAKFGLFGDKDRDIDINGNLQTVIQAGANDSITVLAGGYFHNQNVSYMMEHYFSNHFRWSENFDAERHTHLEGKFRYSRTGTEAKIGIDYITNYHYFSADDFQPHQSNNKIEVLSAELSQKLHWKAIHFDNRLLLQQTNHADEMPLPPLVWESDLSLRFVIAHTLTTQIGCTGYYFANYKAPFYQPAIQQFAVQDKMDCGNYPLFNAYVNCNLKRLKFYVMYSGFGMNAWTNNVFIMPYYPYQSTRVEYGVVFDLQD